MQEPKQAGKRNFKHDPKDITIADNVEWASFEYYTGMEVVKELNLTQKTRLEDFDSFIVCCGDIVILTKAEEFANIKRRIL